MDDETAVALRAVPWLGGGIGGALGPAAAARLRALAQTIAAAERERLQLLVLVAEAQGYAVPDGATLAWDLEADPPAWRVVGAGAPQEGA